MPIIKKSLIILVFLIIFSSLAIAENSECEDYTYSNCPKGCEKSCISSLCEGNACTADCDGPGSCFKLIKDENSFFEDIENDFSEKELEDIKNKDIGSGGITPDSPWYFIDEAFAKVFGEDREEKIAEIITMIEKGD